MEADEMAEKWVVRSKVSVYCIREYRRYRPRHKNTNVWNVIDQDASNRSRTGGWVGIRLIYDSGGEGENIGSLPSDEQLQNYERKIEQLGFKLSNKSGWKIKLDYI